MLIGSTSINGNSEVDNSENNTDNSVHCHTDNHHSNSLGEQIGKLKCIKLFIFHIKIDNMYLGKQSGLLRHI